MNGLGEKEEGGEAVGGERRRNRTKTLSLPLFNANSHAMGRILRVSAVGTLKRYSKALEYEYRVKTAALGTLKRYSILYSFSHFIFRVVLCLLYTL
jgi:hypothetical protein